MTLPLVVLLGAPGTGPEALADALRERITPGTLQITAYTSAPPGAALVLLMGLDQSTQETADARLRTSLAQQGLTYHVVYGQGARRVENALKAIKKIAASAYPQSAGGTFESDSSTQRVWQCEKCSDPECEHRLFTGLLAPGRA